MKRKHIYKFGLCVYLDSQLKLLQVFKKDKQEILLFF